MLIQEIIKHLQGGRFGLNTYPVPLQIPVLVHISLKKFSLLDSLPFEILNTQYPSLGGYGYFLEPHNVVKWIFTLILDQSRAIAKPNHYKLNFSINFVGVVADLSGLFLSKSPPLSGTLLSGTNLNKHFYEFFIDTKRSLTTQFFLPNLVNVQSSWECVKLMKIWDYDNMHV